MDWLDLLAVQGTPKSLLQHYSSKASVLWRSSLLYGPTLTSIELSWVELTELILGVGWEEEKDELLAGPGHCELASPEAPPAQVRQLPWGPVLTSLAVSY